MFANYFCSNIDLGQVRARFGQVKGVKLELYQLLTGVDFPLSVLSYMVAMAMAIYRSYIGHIWAIHKLYISHVQPTVQATDGPYPISRK